MSMEELNQNINEVVNAEVKENETVVNHVTGQVYHMQQIVKETDKFKIVIDQNGKPKKITKYEKFWSYVPETDEEIERLFIVMNSEEDDGYVKPLKDEKGTEIAIKNVFFDPYETLNEETLDIDLGVVTLIEDIEGEFYGTSSKTVHYQLRQIFDSFGYPNTKDYRTTVVKVGKKKANLGDVVTVTLVKRLK